MLLNKKQIIVAIPIFIVMAGLIYYIPVQNLIHIQEHKYDCINPNSQFLQLENGTIIPCKNNKILNDYISFNKTNT